MLHNAVQLHVTVTFPHTTVTQTSCKLISS